MSEKPDIETALMIIEGCAMGSLTPDSRSVDAMAVVESEIERLRALLREMNAISCLVEGSIEYESRLKAWRKAARAAGGGE